MVEHHLAKVGVAGSNPVFRSNNVGGLAQLGERLPCTQEVSGSIPLVSTIIHTITLRTTSSKRFFYFIAELIRYDTIYLTRNVC